MKYVKEGFKLYLWQILLIVISIVLVMIFFPIATGKPFYVSLMTAIIYVAVMYNKVWHIGVKDSRCIPNFYPEKSAPVIISVVLTVLPLLFLIMRIAAPDLIVWDMPFVKGESDFFIKGCVFSGFFDFLYRLWYFAFAAFIPNGNIFVYVLMLFVVPIIVFLAYFLGVKRFSVADFIYQNVVYRGKNNEKRKKKFFN